MSDRGVEFELSTWKQCHRGLHVYNIEAVPEFCKTVLPALRDINAGFDRLVQTDLLPFEGQQTIHEFLEVWTLIQIHRQCSNAEVEVNCQDCCDRYVHDKQRITMELPILWCDVKNILCC